MATNPEQPLATYVERIFQVRRDFALYRDRVEVHAAWIFGKSYHTTVKLANLTTHTKQLYIRNRWTKRSILIGSISVAAAVVFGLPTYPRWVNQAAYIGWVVTACCASIATITFRKTQFTRFLRQDGKPGLDIGKAGSSARQFDDFVEAVKKHIRKA